MHYGNENSKRFICVVIVILFIGGFIKGMYKSNKKETVTTLNLNVEMTDGWSLVKYDKDSDLIILQDDEGTATIQVDGDLYQQTTISETIGDWKITGYQTKDKTYHLYLNLIGSTNVTIDYESNQEVSIDHLRKLIKGIELEK